MGNDGSIELCLFIALAVALIAAVFDIEEMENMTNVVDAAKTDVTQARTGFRAWIADHPFQYTGYAVALGLVVGVVVGVVFL